MRLSMFLMGDLDGSYADLVDQVCLAEQLGFHGVWLAERYFANTDLLWSSPMVAAAYMAARTEHIRLGIAATILPFHHPFRVAFDTLTLDRLCGGRLDLGVTRSSMDDTAHRGFGVSRDDAKERFAESFEILLRALRGEPFGYQGQHYRFDPVEPNPQPAQRPGPPVYLVANADPALEFAAGSALPVFLHGALDVRGVARAQGRYLARAHARGRRPNVLNRFVFVARTNAEARRVMREPFLRFLHERAPDLRAYLLKAFGERGIDFDFLCRQICVFGDAATVAERLTELRQEAGIEHVLCTFNLITLEHAHCLGSIRRFADDVMPRILPRAPARSDLLATL